MSKNLQAKLCTLGIYPENFKTIDSDFGLLPARRTISLSRKKMDIPPISVWVKEMAYCTVLEKLTHMIRGRTEESENVWKQLLEYLEQQGAVG